MSIKDIITVPDETLKKISEPLEKVSTNEKKLHCQLKRLELMKKN